MEHLSVGLVEGTGQLNREARCMGGDREKRSEGEGFKRSNSGSWVPKQLKASNGEQGGRLRAAEQWILGAGRDPFHGFVRGKERGERG